MEWLAIWGVAQATFFVFRPILEDLAKEATKDTAKSYVGQCFKNVFSVIHKKPLTRATGLALKELLELIQDELLVGGVDEQSLPAWTDDVRAFTNRDEVQQAIAALYLDPDYRLLPHTFVQAWDRIGAANTLPEDFSWQSVAKRFARKIADLRQSSAELRETFDSLAAAGTSAGIKELVGLPPDFDLETYREALVERYGNLDFASLDTTGAYYSDVRLWSVFVPQSVRECHEYDPQLLEVPKEHLQRLVAKGELNPAQLAESEKLHDERRRAYVNQPPRPVLEVVGEPTALARAADSLVILGDPGSGKSSLLRFLALRWARIDDANLRYTQPLPLLIELRQYSRWECPSGKGFPKYLHEASTWHRLNQQTLDYLLRQPDRVVLLLDGLDEVFDPAERERVVNDIHRFSNDYKHVRIVVTSRTVGYQPHRLRSAEFRHFMLQDLDADQIGNFLDKWHDVTFDQPEEAKAKQQRLAHAIQNSKSIAQLAGNPLLLTMMAILNRHQELPRDRVDLYQQCARLLLHQWDVERTLGDFPGLSAEIGLREKTDILRTVAYAMQCGASFQLANRGASFQLANPDRQRDHRKLEAYATGSNYIDGTTLTSLIEDYLHTELRFDQARAVARALVEQLRTRNFILCYLGADSYAFVHRTFLEYFCAAEIVHQFNVVKTLSEQDLIALFDAHCRDDDWREVLRLICGQIDEQFVTKIVKHLTKFFDTSHSLVAFAPELTLALECISETRRTGSIVLVKAEIDVKFQTGLYPQPILDVPNFDIAGGMFPVEDYSGDCLNYISRPNDRLALVLADGNRSGVSGSLLLLQHIGRLRDRIEEGVEIPSALASVNALAYSNMPDTTFITMFLFDLEPKRRMFQFIGVGFQGYMLDRVGHWRILESQICPLGVAEDFQVSLSPSERLHRGEILFAATDGLDETVNERGEWLGIERIQEHISRHRQLPAEDLVESVLELSRQFRATRPQYDDIAIVVAKALE